MPGHPQWEKICDELDKKHTARANMIRRQLRPNGIYDGVVLRAMAEVPREHFLPPHMQGIAYVDEDVLLPGDGHLLEPLVLARMIQAARIGFGDRVLVIGCSTGYTGAVVARLAAQVVLVEPAPVTAERVQAALSSLRLENVTVLVRESMKSGFLDEAPYDVILFGGAVEEVPVAIAAQLLENGRALFVVKGSGIGKLTLLQKLDGGIGHRVLSDCQIPLLEPDSQQKFMFYGF